MGFFSRLFGSKDYKDTQSASEMAVDEKDIAEALAEIDIDAAITAHEKWKQRLLDYINHKSDENLNSKIICMDDVCDLGKWLHGAGAGHFDRYPAFGILVARHQYFHVQASKVVDLVQEKKEKEAIELMNGAYAHGSNQTIILLKELKRGLRRRR